MSASMIVVFALFTLALGIAVMGMLDARNRFAHFLDHDQALQEHISRGYSEALLAGQALRNVVLDPQNEHAARNLNSARVGFRDALENALELAQDDPETLRVLREVINLHDRQMPVHDTVSRLARTDQAAAIATLNTDETPIWREIRLRMQQVLKDKNEQIDTIKAATMRATQQRLTISIAVTIAAIIAGLGIATWLTRSLLQQLGGEPVEAMAVASGIASGNLAVNINVSDDDRQSMMSAMKTMRDNLSQLVSQVRDDADSIATASRQIAAGNQDLASRTEEQASSLHETAASLEELTATVKQNADNALQANQLAINATASADNGGKVVHQVIETMHEIGEASTKITEIIGVIDSIAFQTNILALNAAVEAARAGEQGRGFAVVAAEVRSLAQRSASAAHEIKALIEDAGSKVDAGQQLVTEAGSAMHEIYTGVQGVADIIGEISMASQEQTGGIGQINQAVVQMDEVTQQNAALVQEAAAASEALLNQARELTALVATFQLEADGASTGNDAFIGLPLSADHQDGDWTGDVPFASRALLTRTSHGSSKFAQET